MARLVYFFTMTGNISICTPNQNCKASYVMERELCRECHAVAEPWIK